MKPSANNSSNFLGKDYIPDNDAERLAVLQQYNLAYHPSEEAFQNLVHIIADDFEVPIALISLVDKEEVFFKAHYGMPGVKSKPRGMSLCSLAILSPHTMVIENAADDPCLISNPLVHGSFGLRFYAGAPIETTDGFRLGSVCILDTQPRTLSQRQQDRLKRYADIVMHEMSLRRAFLEQEQALKEETERRQQLITQAMVMTQERERTEIGLELHDNVSQILTTVKLYNEMALDGLADTPSIMVKSNQYLQQCIDEIRELSRRLSAPTLGKISLEDSISELVASYAQKNPGKVFFKYSAGSDLQVAEDLHLAIYRIIQEKLNIVTRHHRADKLCITLQQQTGGLLLAIEDHGPSDLKAEQSVTQGLNNMQLRAESLNGRFELVEQPGNGSRLQVFFPL